MCDFCVRHGDGKRWYLNAANYATEMLADVQRDKYIRDFLPDVSKNGRRWLRLLDFSRRIAPGLTGHYAAWKSERMKEIHFGQVIPIEDIEAAMGVVGQVVRLPCVCREALHHKQIAVCYLLAADPQKIGMRDLLASRPAGIPFAESLERVEPGQALAEMRDLEKQGMIHTIWTFITPFIAGLCNCNPTDCLAMNFTARGLRLYFPGEFVAKADTEQCTGCGECRGVCLFSAISVEDHRVRIDPARCHGCGICRPACSTQALRLLPRPA